MTEISPPTLTSPITAPIPHLVPHQPGSNTAKPIRICVFCSTQTGRPSTTNTSDTPSSGPPPPNPAVTAATELAQHLHAHNAHLVYGGGSTGLMGTVARERVRLGGPATVLGVIPYALVDSERAGLGREGIPALLGSKDGQRGSSGGDSVTSGSEDRKPRLEGATNKVKQIFSSKKRNQSRDLSSEVGASSGDETTTTAPGAIPATDPSPSLSTPKEPWETWSEVYTLPTDAQYGRVVGTPSLNQRKAVMMEAVKHGAAGSGFIALPGGFGSLDEVLAVLTARQLGQHRRSMVLVDVDGFWRGLEEWMDGAVQKGFLGVESRGFVKVVGSVGEAVDWLVGEGEWRL